MPAPPAIQVLRVDWSARSGELLAVRRAVFVLEQGVPEELEIDEHDPLSLHFLALGPGPEPVGTARLLPTKDGGQAEGIGRVGRIGRVAVLAPWRRHGVGRLVMLAAIDAARERGDRELYLHAQDHSIPFYGSLGFVAVGPSFDEAGIPHREMRLGLSTRLT